MITRLILDQFKAFERFTLHVRGDAFLAGPNNAGKSTLLAALRTAARMIRQAQRLRASENFFDRGRNVPGHPFNLGQFGLIEENLRHEFREHEARLAVRFKSGANLTAVWPADPDVLSPFFYLHQGGMLLGTPKEVGELVPSIGTVPVLSPIDHAEAILTSDKYIRENLDGRLASRHFRNHSYSLVEKILTLTKLFLNLCRSGSRKSGSAPYGRGSVSKASLQTCSTPRRGVE